MLGCPSSQGFGVARFSASFCGFWLGARRFLQVLARFLFVFIGFGAVQRLWVEPT